MKWYYKQLGGYTYVRVFMNSRKRGDLVFRNEEFRKVKEESELNDALAETLPPLITFIPE